MSALSRRDFLRGLASLAAVASTPVLIETLAREWDSAGRIIGRTFYLRETLDLRGLPKDFEITNCIFQQAAEFTGPLVRVPGDRNGLVSFCHFKTLPEAKNVMLQIDGPDNLSIPSKLIFQGRMRHD